MSDQLITSVVWVIMAIIGVAVVALLVSKKSDTAKVIGTSGSEFSCILQTAVSPLLGGAGCHPSVTSSISFA